MNIRIISKQIFDAIVQNALIMANTIGMETTKTTLIEKAVKCAGMYVKNGRIYPSMALLEETLDKLFPNRGIIPADSPRPEKPLIIINNRPFLIADHKNRKLCPLSRQNVVDSAKLIAALAHEGVYGTTGGTPQEACEQLRGIEQYIIGYRFSPHGGSTEVPISDETRPFFNEIILIAEGRDLNAQRHFFNWLVSPMRLDGNEIDDFLAYKGRPLSIGFGSMPIMGLSGPVDPVGIFTLSIAECIAATAIFHGLFPELPLSTPNFHPQPMDPTSALMAFGTSEWNNLDLIKREIFAYFGHRITNKENLTSACMPDAMAQAEKVASIALGIAWEADTFQMYPLCNDEVWSAVQCLLDVEHVHNTWNATRPAVDISRASTAVDIIRECVETSGIAAQCVDTLLQLRNNYRISRLTRLHSCGRWIEAGIPDPLHNLEQQVNELISSASYAPSGDSMNRIIGIYERACRHFAQQPMPMRLLE